MSPTTTTTSRQVQPGRFHDAAEWLHSLGDVPLERIVMDPWPGTATEQDLLTFVERDKRLVELIDGTLVEKPVGYYESLIAAYLITALNNFVIPRKLGGVSGEGGPLRLKSSRVRLPDVAFVSVDDAPVGRALSDAVPSLVFRLAVEVLSKGNTVGEMRQKRKEYFESGTRLVWEVDPRTRIVAVYESAESPTRTLTESDTLDGGTVLPGFTLPVAELFSVLPKE